MGRQKINPLLGSEIDDWIGAFYWNAISDKKFQRDRNCRVCHVLPLLSPSHRHYWSFSKVTTATHDYSSKTVPPLTLSAVHNTTRLSMEACYCHALSHELALNQQCRNESQNRWINFLLVTCACVSNIRATATTQTLINVHQVGH
jgi:hypothetical protein